MTDEQELTIGQRAVLALDDVPVLLEQGHTERLEGSFGRKGLTQAHKIAAETHEVGLTSLMHLELIKKRKPAALKKVRSGDWRIARALRESGYMVSNTPVREGGTSIFGKGDKWREVAWPLRRYLAAWEKREYAFKHVNHAEARRRLKLLDELITGLEAARSDLEQRTHKATLSLRKD